MRKQKFNREPSRFIQVLTNSCQICKLCHIEIIKADYCQLLRDIDAKLVRNLNHTEGLKIGRGKNSRRRVRGAKQINGCLTCLFHRIGCQTNEFVIKYDTCFLQALPEPHQSQADGMNSILRQIGIPQECNSAMSLCDKEFSNHPPASHIINFDTIQSLVREFDEDCRDVMLQQAIHISIFNRERHDY